MATAADRDCLDVERIPGGARLWLRLDAGTATQDIVKREAQCCGFLDFEQKSDGDRLRLDISSISPRGAQVAAFLAGIDPAPDVECC
jgi:hypothetical protein